VRRPYYGASFDRNGSYSSVGRPLRVRTFVSEAERQQWLDEAPQAEQRAAVPARMDVTERRSGRTMPIAEAVPGI
jgi:hypothetical protein